MPLLLQRSPAAGRALAWRSRQHNAVILPGAGPLAAVRHLFRDHSSDSQWEPDHDLHHLRHQRPRSPGPRHPQTPGHHRHHHHRKGAELSSDWPTLYLGAKLAYWSGLCYFPYDTIPRTLQEEGLHLVAYGRTNFTCWYVADGYINFDALRARALPQRPSQPAREPSLQGSPTVSEPARAAAPSSSAGSVPRGSQSDTDNDEAVGSSRESSGGAASGSGVAGWRAGDGGATTADSLASGGLPTRQPRSGSPWPHHLPSRPVAGQDAASPTGEPSRVADSDEDQDAERQPRDPPHHRPGLAHHRSHDPHRHQTHHPSSGASHDGHAIHLNVPQHPPLHLKLPTRGSADPGAASRGSADVQGPASAGATAAAGGSTTAGRSQAASGTGGTSPVDPGIRCRFIFLRGVQWAAHDINTLSLSASLAAFWPTPLLQPTEIAAAASSASSPSSPSSSTASPAASLPEDHLVAHSGVAALARDLMPALLPYIKDAAADGVEHVVFAGHSLGGSLGKLLWAMTLLQGHRTPQTTSCHTFGSPPLLAHAAGGGGGRVLRLLRAPPASALNWVLEHDPVPRAMLTADPYFAAARAALPGLSALLALRGAVLGEGAALSSGRFLYETVGELLLLRWSTRGGCEVVPVSEAEADSLLKMALDEGVTAPVRTLQYWLDHHHASYHHDLEAAALATCRLEARKHSQAHLHPHLHPHPHPHSHRDQNGQGRHGQRTALRQQYDGMDGGTGYPAGQSRLAARDEEEEEAGASQPERTAGGGDLGAALERKEERLQVPG